MRMIDVRDLLSACFSLALVVRGDVLWGWFETLDFRVFTISLRGLGFPFGRPTRISSLFGIPFLGVSKVQLISIPSQGLGVLVEIALTIASGS